VRRIAGLRGSGKSPDGDAKVLEWDGTQETVRNFSIIAHVDHGKSTLSDAILQHVGNITSDHLNTQTLDTLNVEKERGITVKAMTASMLHYHKKTGKTYLLNLIDTPGHVDFTYEVSRSLAACQGTLLLVDATQGIQAQTIANFYLALEKDLSFVPVVTKTDLFHADFETVAEEMESAFAMEVDEILQCSGKTGEGVPEVIDALVERIPPPSGNKEGDARALICDSWFEEARGVILLVQVRDGELKQGDRLVGYHSERAYEVVELGILTPFRSQTDKLSTGQVGYVICNVRDPSNVRLGDTLVPLKDSKKSTSVSAVSEAMLRASIQNVEPLPGFEPAKPMVFAGLFAEQSQHFDQMRVAIEKLTLNDASVVIAPESSEALGVGFRCGFLGLLHMEVFTQRLEEEFGAEVIVTAPTVPYQVTLNTGDTVTVSSAAEFPDSAMITEVAEPMVQTTIIASNEYLGSVMDLCRTSRGTHVDSSALGKGRLLLRHRIPLQQIVATSFYNKLKASTSGFASFEYEDAGYEPAPLTKMEIRVNGKPVDALSVIVHRSFSQQQARTLLQKLKGMIDRQSFEIVLQAAIGSKIVARERIAPYRKDVLTKSGKTVGGGDESRKKKLLQKQKAGKKRMKTVGRVQLSQEVFTAVMRQD